MAKKILLILTGGTLAMVEDVGLLRPADNRDIVRHVPEISKIADLTVIDLFNIDSADIQIHHWVKVAETIYQHVHDYDGFVIVHGTDTMTYTATALSFMLNNLHKPVIMTGSQKPISDILTDARNNLLNAIFLATQDIPEVCIYFDYKLYRGNRTKKMSSTQFAAFSSPNYPVLATVGTQIQVQRKLLRKPSGMMRVYSNFDTRVNIQRTFPGLKPSYLTKMLDTDVRAIILQGFGMGNLPSVENSLIPFIEQATQKGIIVAIASQSSRGGVSLDQYESANKAKASGAISTHDMTIETSLVKMMYLLGQFNDNRLVADNFELSIAGELGSTA
jgi:L-asparaginase